MLSRAEAVFGISSDRSGREVTLFTGQRLCAVTSAASALAGSDYMN